MHPGPLQPAGAQEDARRQLVTERSHDEQQVPQQVLPTHPVPARDSRRDGEVNDLGRATPTTLALWRRASGMSGVRQLVSFL